jgi:excisionase family DNA binding protein
MNADGDDDDGAIERATIARKGSPFLNTAQAAHYLGISHRKLEEMREEGIGPIYRKHGKAVRYHIDDLDAWSEASRRAHIGPLPSPRRPR